MSELRHWVCSLTRELFKGVVLANMYRYQNGTILIATLHPIFDIIHKLTTSRGPSPLIGLAWHASSAKQKSDMLASQALNGDLRVWSVLKPPEKDIPRTIRVLKRSDAAPSGPQWMAWSKNGKIVQYMNGYVHLVPKGDLHEICDIDE